MIFYGKASRRASVAAALGEIAGWIGEAVTAPLPIERHAAWVSALVEAGGLAQGLADAEEGSEGASPSGSALAMTLCAAVAAVMGRSWDSAFAVLPDAVPAAVADSLAALRNAPGFPEAVEIRRTEGFAHYAVYPEGHWQAAAALAAPRPTRVLGLRSIGTALSAAAAAALGAPAPRTARPSGHPFDRRVALAPALDIAERDAVWAIVDEGPGLSGSSMGAAADALGAAGVRADRILLLPGHAGPPGPRASDAHRRLWATARSAVVPFEDLAHDGARSVGAWVEDLAGAPLAPPEDIAGGGWRRHAFADEAAWPAVDRQNERRKYLVRGRRGSVVMRFAGLAGFGREKLRRATMLAEAGYGIAPLGLRHGFLVEPWRDDLRPASPGGAGRTAVLSRLAGYLAFRARAFPAAPDDGASLDALLAMARVNAGEALGEDAAARAGDWAGRIPALARVARRVGVDGRLAPHEWLHDGAAVLLKTDALDHCCGHDLVGCQDVAWDVAGAAVEWDLTDAEAEALRAAVARDGARCDPELVAFFRLAYPAFRVGTLTMALEREGGAEAARLEAALRPQVAALRRALA